RLPEKYRLPVQLCYLEGRTHDEAAAQLACPVGTVRTRLAWARDRLRDRLSRRGVTLSAICIHRSLVSLKAPREVPTRLAEATFTAASGRAIGTAATTLAAGVMRTMLMKKLTVGLIALVGLGATAIGVGVGVAASGRARQPAPQPLAPERRVLNP